MGKISKNEVKQDLRKAKSEVDGILTISKYKYLGEFGFKTAIRRFGSWNEAKSASFDNVEKETFGGRVDIQTISKDEVLNDVEKVSKKVDGFISRKDYIEYGSHDIKTIQRNWGWNSIKKELGLNIEFFPDDGERNPMKNKNIKKRASETIQSLYDRGKHGALGEANRLKTSKQAKKQWADGTFCSDIFPSGEDHFRWTENPSEYYYGVDWPDIAEKVRKRDNYVCQRCGKPQEEVYSSLHVHHIKKFKNFDSKERANQMDNLVSLCFSCHRVVETMPVRVDVQ